ncbi:hypothetical protein DYH09_21090 [bacterium CPR1]|nr:hypothetical protein [bacterium CPR1]
MTLQAEDLVVGKKLRSPGNGRRSQTGADCPLEPERIPQCEVRPLGGWEGQAEITIARNSVKIASVSMA